MLRILVLAGHFELLDRRISAEVNSLSKAGYQVTLVSVPARIASGQLSKSVTVIQPKPGTGGWVWQVRSLIPRFIQNAAYRLVGNLPVRRDPYHLSFYLNATPSEHFDVIHCHDLDTLPAAVALKERMGQGTRLVYDAHELYPHQWPEGPERAFWEETERRHIKHADAIITVNPALASLFTEQYGVSEPQVIYNSWGYTEAPSPQALNLLEYFGAIASGRKVLFQGRVTVSHNIQTVVKGFRGLEGRASLFVLGDGSLAPALARECQANHVKNVFFGAAVESTVLLSLTQQADVGLIPYVDNGTLNQRFCTPNKLFEYIEAGLPICAGDLPELRRIVRGEGIGEVYPMSTEAEFAAAMTDFLDRLDAGDFPGERRQAAREKYSWAKQEEQLLALYQRLSG